MFFAYASLPAYHNRQPQSYRQPLNLAIRCPSSPMAWIDISVFQHQFATRRTPQRRSTIFNPHHHLTKRKNTTIYSMY